MTRKLLATVVLSLLLTTILHAQDIPNPFPPGGISVSTLANGLRVVVREDHSLPIVAMAVVVRGGAAATARSRGMAHYLEHLVFQGTAKYPEPLAPQLALEQAGGISNGVTSRDATRYQAAMASDQAELLVNVLADITLAPKLTAAAFTRERHTILQEIQREKDNPVAVALERGYLQSYTAHPYRFSPMGSIEDILGLTLDDVRAFHRTWYVPNNMSVVLVGDITPARALTLAQAAFGEARATILPAFPAPEADAAPATGMSLAGSELPDAYQVLAFPAPAIRDFQAVATTDTLLTLLVEGDEAMLRGWWEKSGVPVKSFGGEFITARDPGRLLLWAQTPAANPRQWRDATLALLRQISTATIPAATLDAVKRRLAVRYLLENESYSQQAATLSFYEAMGGDGALQAGRYLQAIQSVTPDGLARAVPSKILTWVILANRIEGGI